ncbi:MAG: PAS domain-containing protein [Taibaiella sp.]|nr:PAS domain-containing protein [Taibaiella sp.]
MKNNLSSGNKAQVTQGKSNRADFFQKIAMNTPGLSAVIRGRDTNILFANQAFSEFTGYSDSLHDSKYFSGYLEPFQRDRFYQHLLEVKQRPDTGNRFVIYSLRDRVNEPAAFYLYVSPIEGETDEDDLFYIFMVPDRSRWGTPFTSFDTRELFLELFKGEDFGTFEWIIDADKVYWSAGVYLIYEVDPAIKEINFAFARQYFHKRDQDVVMEQIKAALRSGTELNMEYRIVTARNNVKLLQCVGRVVYDRAGRAIKLAGSIRDITTQRTIENNMRKMVDELHRSNRELEEFAYAASHDLQEPLRKITTFSDRLSEKYKDVLAGEGEMYLTRMVSSAENMRQLINGLLEFSRISQSAGQFEETDLNSTMQEVLSDLELKVEETGTVVRCDVLPVVEAVRTQMKQLFQNLISNAIKFQKAGTPPIIKIEVTMPAEGELQKFNLSPAKGYHKIVVSDNGIGFENEYAMRIFQVFQRLHGKSEYPGSGIGLAICKKILEYHHGTIYAESEPGKGSKFTFLLPEHHS